MATPAYTRRHRNPYREWIGAQIRSDPWGWACAGRPALAAEFAFRDACWTHERNGIYGAMMFAAIQAAAFVERDPTRLIEIGLSEILANSRLARAVRSALQLVTRHEDWETCMTAVEDHCAELSPNYWSDDGKEVRGMHPVHTINNAMICVLGLVYGGMEAERCITIAVSCGLDTDCNGATVGSVVGARSGRCGLEGGLAERLNDTIRPNLVGVSTLSMSHLAQRTAAQWEQIDAWSQARG